jgi:hypothetical protein
MTTRLANAARLMSFIGVPFGSRALVKAGVERTAGRRPRGLQ